MQVPVCDRVRRLTAGRTLCHRRNVVTASCPQRRVRAGARVLAAVTAAWLVVCGVLAAHHEATVRHVRSAAGGYAHGKVLAGHHTGRDSDIHGQRNPDADAGDCALLTAFHQPATGGVAAPAVAVAVHAVHKAEPPRASAVIVAAALYRLAPKTSPPVA
jgi:hypothetical protein